jgi:hypothetical protein
MGKQSLLHFVQSIQPSAAFVKVHPSVPFAPFFKSSVYKAPDSV